MLLTKTNLCIYFLLISLVSASLEDQLVLNKKKRDILDVLRNKFFPKNDEELAEGDLGENNATNYYTSDFGTGIYIKFKGETLNICEGRYIELAANAHLKIADILIAACSGHSGFKWLVNKIGDNFFNKPNKE
ncbi:hypothetical protein BpHYR1_003042 [Brachionus plicatilis]|uniref:Uncharacterized protein n=1 Tax=Brachionus plicatilis TaxID=10195 RepID=A0A3M7R080_BRAPC|nr:hypothetical protein BpHYR1_003042 [Brachionus plicatilis]